MDKINNTLEYDGEEYLRMRLVLSCLSGRRLVINDVRTNEFEPGFKGIVYIQVFWKIFVELFLHKKYWNGNHSICLYFMLLALVIFNNWNLMIYMNMWHKVYKYLTSIHYRTREEPNIPHVKVNEWRVTEASQRRLRNQFYARDVERWHH